MSKLFFWPGLVKDGKTRDIFLDTMPPIDVSSHVNGRTLFVFPRKSSERSIAGRSASRLTASCDLANRATGKIVHRPG
jgi:hypothetical protein